MEKKNIMCIMREICCGCAACEAICPVDAIKMKLDEDGFYYPIVEESICVHCGLCLKVCVQK